jgi:hypothetical protein
VVVKPRQHDLPAVEDVLEGHREHIGLLGTGEVRDVGVEGDALLGGTGLGNSQADTEDGVGTELGLVRSSVELNQELVDLGLVNDIDVGLDKGRSDDLVDVLDSLENTLAAPLGLVTITELASLVLAYKSSCIRMCLGI